MEPMKPMAPMQPMAAMSRSEAWWPEDLGQPASSGSQDNLRYAFFPDRKRLLVERGGKLETYDTGDYKINGISQRGGGAEEPVFTSESGTVDLGALKVVD